VAESEDDGLGEVLRGLVAWLDARDAPFRHEAIGHQRPVAGYSGQTLLVDLRRTDAEGVHAERLAVKLPPSGPAIVPTYDYSLLARVQEAVAERGVPAAVPARVELDPAWIGTPFFVMPAVEGDVFGEIPVLDRRLSRAEPVRNSRVHTAYLDVLADIHRIDWRACGLDDVVPCRDDTAELDHWRAYLAWFTGGEMLVPQLADAFAWCEANRPAGEPDPSLLWGDVRLGNMIFDAGANPVAVLDWEMATIGSAEHDLAWLLTLAATQDELVGRTVPGFLDRVASLRRYETRLGRPVRDLEWYEVFAMVRSTAIMTRISYLNGLRGEPVMLPIADNPILDQLARRIDAASGR
jgi:aminoglycoside phosphotransferase (APT) family kinase protein